MKISSLSFMVVLLVSCASPRTNTAIDQEPMYRGVDRNSDSTLKAADEKLIRDTTAA